MRNTFGGTSLDERSALRKGRYQDDMDKHKRNTFVSTAEFELKPPEIQNQLTYVLDSTVTGIKLL